ncbi:MAG: shikimate kinase [Verrucomicrobiota bacterium]
MIERGTAIVLIGFMGMGKSSVGQLLAERTGWRKFDTDELVAAKFALPIAEIFARFGEDRFRDAETSALRELPREGDSIVVTGGGTILRAKNVQLLREIGTIVCLNADEERLFERLASRRNRPLLQTSDPRATMKELLRSRETIYKKAADIMIDTSDLTHEEVADEVIKELKTLSVQR